MEIDIDDALICRWPEFNLAWQALERRATFVGVSRQDISQTFRALTRGPVWQDAGFVLWAILQHHNATQFGDLQDDLLGKPRETSVEP